MPSKRMPPQQASCGYKGLWRVHYHLSIILMLSMKGKSREAMAYMVQLLRALHQVQIDNGSWATAMHLLPRRESATWLIYSFQRGSM